MTTAIWTLKGIIALIFTITGLYKILLPKAKLLDKGMKGLMVMEESQIKITGSLEVLGAVGLIFPAMLDIFPILSLISAICLSLTMIVAGWVNNKLNLSLIPNMLIFAICILIVILELKYY